MFTITLKRTKKMVENKKTDEEILFEEAEIEGIKVKPWSFGVLFEITEDLENIIAKLDSGGVDIDKLLIEGLTWSGMVRLFASAAPHILRIIARTTGTDIEEIKDLPMDAGIKLAMLIYAQNVEQIKNALSLSRVEVE